jgi:hypothetical protein
MNNVREIVGSWPLRKLRSPPFRRRMNYFGQPYCPTCQKRGQDAILSETSTREALTCPAGHLFPR